jgi:hypothetical protein
MISGKPTSFPFYYKNILGFLDALVYFFSISGICIQLINFILDLPKVAFFLFQLHLFTTLPILWIACIPIVILASVLAYKRYQTQINKYQETVEDTQTLVALAAANAQHPCYASIRDRIQATRRKEVSPSPHPGYLPSKRKILQAFGENLLLFITFIMGINGWLTGLTKLLHIGLFSIIPLAPGLWFLSPLLLSLTAMLLLFGLMIINYKAKESFEKKREVLQENLATERAIYMTLHTVLDPLEPAHAEYVPPPEPLQPALYARRPPIRPPIKPTVISESPSPRAPLHSTTQIHRLYPLTRADGTQPQHRTDHPHDPLPRHPVDAQPLHTLQRPHPNPA